MALPPKQWEPAELRRMLSETTNEAAAVVLRCDSKVVAGLRAKLDIPIPWQQRGSRFFDQVRKVAVERWKDYPARKPEHLTLQEIEAIITERMKPIEPEVTKPQRLEPAGVVEAVRRYVETHGKAPSDEDIARENGWDPDRVHRILFHQRHVILRNHDSGTYYLADELWEGNYKPSEMEGENVAKPRKLPPDEQLLKEVEEIKASGGPVERTLMERYGVLRGSVSTALHRARVNLQHKPVEPPKVQIITTEDPEADIKANGERPAGTPEQAAPQPVEAAKAPEVDLAPGDEWRQATTTEELNREVLSSNLPSISDPVFTPVHQRLTQKFEEELWRRVRQDVIDILAEELTDDATFGRVVRRLRAIRVGVA